MSATATMLRDTACPAAFKGMYRRSVPAV